MQIFCEQCDDCCYLRIFNEWPVHLIPYCGYGNGRGIPDDIYLDKKICPDRKVTTEE